MIKAVKISMCNRKYESNERSSVKILCHYLKIHPKTSIIKNYNVRGKRCSGYRRKAR